MVLFNDKSGLKMVKRRYTVEENHKVQYNNNLTFSPAIMKDKDKMSLATAFYL